MPAAVPAWVVTAAVVAARVAGYVSRTGYDDRAVAATVVTWAVVAVVAACDGDADYCQYHCCY